jgi:Kef-type K+ transport system membrane component KefB
MDWAAVQLSPAFGFTVVGLVIVFGPLVAERLRLPGLLGLLAFGAIIGPSMLDVLPRFVGLQAVGGIGVLAVSQNPETSAASAVSPMNLPLGGTLGS